MAGGGAGEQRSGVMRYLMMVVMGLVLAGCGVPFVPLI